MEENTHLHQKETVLVTGATGFVGSLLVKTLLEKGDNVRIIHRKSSDLSPLNSYLNKIELFEADLLDVTLLEDALQGVSKIYHSAAHISYDPSERDRLFKINAEGTANLVNMALRAGVKRMVYISSIAALLPLPDQLINEDYKWEDNPWMTQYGISKMLGEMEIYRGIAEGLEAVIVQPGVIIGPGFWEKKMPAKVFERVEKGLPFYLKGSNGYVDVRDVVNTTVALMDSGQYNGERFILIAENLSFRTFIQYVADALQKKAPDKAIQPWMVRGVVIGDWLRSKLTGTPRKVYYENLHQAMYDFKYSNEKIKKTLNYSFIPIKETVNEMAVLYKQYKQQKA